MVQIRATTINADRNLVQDLKALFTNVSTFMLLLRADTSQSKCLFVVQETQLIDEVDPWFNFRATKYLVQNGFYNFWDWFDDSKP